MNKIIASLAIVSLLCGCTPALMQSETAKRIVTKGLEKGGDAKDRVRAIEKRLQDVVCDLDVLALETWRQDRQDSCIMIEFDCAAARQCQAEKQVL